MAIYRLKNATNNNIDLHGIIISAQSYYDIPEAEVHMWRYDEELFQYIADGIIIVNKGQDIVDDITNPLEGWNYFKGETTPPADSLGRWKIIADDPRKDKDKEIFIWNIAVFLNSLEEYEEVMRIPASATYYFEQFVLTSVHAEAKAELQFLTKDENENYFVFSPILDLKNISYNETDAFVSAGSNTVHVSSNSEMVMSLNFYPLSSMYCFYTETSGIIHVNKLTNVDHSAQTMTFENVFPRDIPEGTKIVFVERPLLRTVADRNTTSIRTTYPYIAESPNGTDYLKIKISNMSVTEATQIYTLLYGYKENKQ